MLDYNKRADPYNVRQASRIYFLPNLMTAGNLFCGFLAVICCIQARMVSTGSVTYGTSAESLYQQAVWLILAAVIFDSLDGRLARLGGRESLFGAEFDSLADVISFGMAPALMVFYLILSPTQGYPFFLRIGWLLSFVYLLCAAVRLARFNVITNPLLRDPKLDSNKDFIGLPVPAAAGTVASLVLLLTHLSQEEKSLQNWALILPFLLFLVAILMVSTIRFPSFKQIDWKTKTRLRTFVLIFVFGIVIIIQKEYAFLLIFLCYIGYGLISHFRRISRISRLAKERKTP